MSRFPALSAFALTIGSWCSSTHAAFVDLGVGAIYDSTRNITWTQDVRYDEVDLLSSQRMASLYGTTIVNSDGTTHIITDADVYQSPGSAFRVGGTWWGATAWATTLAFSGVTGWRLPTESELVGVVSDPSYRYLFGRIASGSLPYQMWTGTEVGVSSVTQVETIPSGGNVYYSLRPVPKQQDVSGSFIQVAWAVHPGNILAAPVPEPGTSVLIGCGLICVLSLNRRSRWNQRYKAT